MGRFALLLMIGAGLAPAGAFSSEAGPEQVALPTFDDASIMKARRALRGGAVESGHATFTSGADCEANGAISITTLADCSAAGAALGFSYRRKSCGGWCPAVDDGQDGVSYDPPYCYAEHGVLKFNSAGTNTGGCKRDTCICWLNAPPPPAPPPWQLCFPSCCKHACIPSEILRWEGVVCDCVGLYPKWCGPGRVWSLNRARRCPAA